jgi:hypothetical protein
LGFKWSWHAWVKFSTDLFRVAHSFIYTKDLASRHIDWGMIKWWFKMVGEQEQKLQIKSMATKESGELNYEIFCANARVFSAQCLCVQDFWKLTIASTAWVITAAQTYLAIVLSVLHLGEYWDINVLNNFFRHLISCMSFCMDLLLFGQLCFFKYWSFSHLRAWFDLKSL